MEDTEIDYTAGNGAMDEEECFTDENALYEADGRSSMETSFNSNEADQGTLMSDGERRPWSYFYKKHEGYYEDNRSERNRKANIRRDAATFASHVDLSTHQKRRVIYHVDNLDLNSFGCTSTEIVILALITYVCNVDDRWVQRESEFLELCNSLDIQKDTVKRTTRSVKDKI